MKTIKNWTVIDVMDRFEEAASTLKCLPRVKVQGYFNVYPAVVRTAVELLQAEKLPMELGPPSAGAISRMEETILWIFFLQDEDERRLIWLRAERIRWKPICKRLGIGRTTAHYKHRLALFKIVTRLNAAVGGR